MEIKFNPRTGQFEADQEYRAAFRKDLRDVLRNGRSAVLGRQMIGPIRTFATYQSWTKHFFTMGQVSRGEEWPVVRISDYTALAWNTSPEGTPLYVRPGRRYTRVSFQHFQSGMEIGWHDSEEAGWDLLAQHSGEVGEELARKKDTAAQTVLDAAITALGTTHTIAASGAMTKGAVDTVLRRAAVAQFPIRFAVLSQARAYDIGDWGVDAGWLWGNLPTSYGEEVLRQGYFSNYGGITWIIEPNCPSGSVYFSGDPSAMGQFHWQYGSSEVRSGEDMDRGVTKYRYDETHGWLVAGGMALYKLTVS